MCGRYFLNSAPADIDLVFDIDARDNFPPRYNIAPTQPIAVIRLDQRRRREYALVRWGFIPEWAKKDFAERMKSRPLINARAETAAEKPTFRSAYRRRRCLVPADGFYEWVAKGAAKQAYCIRPAEEGVFAFAGIWETALAPDGGEIDTAAILTTAAGPDLKAIHHREPVVISRRDAEQWLYADERDAGALAEMLTPAPRGAWHAYPVASDVNSVRNDGPHLIEPEGFL